jgi:hypothetical protein
MAGFPANFKEWAEVPSPEMKNFWVIATFAGKAFCGGVVIDGNLSPLLLLW